MATTLPARAGIGPAARPVDLANGGDWRLVAEAALCLALFLALLAAETAVSRAARPPLLACAAAGYS
jgi:hypothetical protein